MAIINSNIDICSIVAQESYFTTLPANTGADTRTFFSELGTNLYEVAGNNSEETIFENDILRITAKANKSASRPKMDSNKALTFYDKRTNSEARNLGLGNLRQCYIALGYDSTEQKAYYFITGQFYYSGSWTEDPYAVCVYGLFGGTTSQTQQMYELISGSQIPEFNWQPVPSITGKLGTFNLSTIKEASINGGNPVSGASASNFDSLESSTKLSILLEEVSS